MSELPAEAVEAAARAISALVGQFDLDGPKHPTINELAAAVVTAAYPLIAAQVRRDTREKIAAEIETCKVRAGEFWSDVAERNVAYTNAARIARGVAADGQDAAT